MTVQSAFTGKKHFAASRRTREEVVIVGFNRKEGTCLVVIFNSLAKMERDGLIDAALHPTAQEIDFLVDSNREKSYLAHIDHPMYAGKSWEEVIMTYLQSGLSQYVTTLNLSDMVIYNEEQSRVFDGSLDATYLNEKDAQNISHPMSDNDNQVRSELDELKAQIAALTAALNNSGGPEKVAQRQREIEDAVETFSDPQPVSSNDDENKPSVAPDISWV